MKHLYWIISGVLALAIVVTWFLIVPTEDARETKKRLDGSAKDLHDLEKRALHKLSGVYDAENPADTTKLAHDYLITEKWKLVLQPHVEKYEKQLDAVKKSLVARGEFLRRKIAPTSDVLEWYSA